MNENAKLAIFVVLIMLIVSMVVFGNLWMKKSTSSDEVLVSVQSSNVSIKSSLTPGSILVADDVGNISSSNLSIPFITKCCDTIQSLIKEPSNETDSLYVKKPDTYTLGSPMTYNPSTGSLEKVVLPTNSILSTDDNGDIVSIPSSLSDCCGKNSDNSLISQKLEAALTLENIDGENSKIYSTSKVDELFQKKALAPPNSIVMTDASGNLVDSGFTAKILNECCIKTDNALPKTAITDSQIGTSTTFSSAQIDAVYQKKAIGNANSLVVLDSSGNLVDSGFTPQFLQNCCSQDSTGSSNGLMKSDIVDTSISNTKLYSSEKIDATYQKKSTAPANALLMTDSSGNLVDSGITTTFINACCSSSVNTTTAFENALLKSDISDMSINSNKLYSSAKIDATYQKKIFAAANALLVSNGSGDLVDSGLTTTGIQSCCDKAVLTSNNSLLKSDIIDTSVSDSKLYSSSKIDATYQKKSTAPANALLMTDASGNLVDSGLTPTFISACCTNATANNLQKSDIVDSSASDSKLYSSSKIDATYQKKTTAPVNTLLMPDVSGNLVDSGLTPTFINACCNKSTAAYDLARKSSLALFLSYKTLTNVNISTVNVNILLNHEVNVFDNTDGFYKSGKFNPKIAGVWRVKVVAGVWGLTLNNRVTLTLAKNSDFNPAFKSVYLMAGSTLGNTNTSMVDSMFDFNGTTDFVSSYLMLSKDAQNFTPVEYMSNTNYFEAIYMGPSQLDISAW